MKSNETSNDSKYWKDLEEYKRSLNGYYVRLKLMETYSNDLLHLNYLIENGLNAAPQGPQRINERLIIYIENVSLDDEDIIYPDSEGIDELYEGALKTVTVNTYERNPFARKKCLEYYKYNCQVCNINFEEQYGQLGKNFIHVHHIVAISSVNKEYKVDPIKDLIPVCPNCYAMLHKKNYQGNFFSVEELKKK